MKPESGERHVVDCLCMVAYACKDFTLAYVCVCNRMRACQWVPLSVSLTSVARDISSLGRVPDAVLVPGVHSGYAKE